jgi:cytochrome P450
MSTISSRPLQADVEAFFSHHPQHDRLFVASRRGRRTAAAMERPDERGRRLLRDEMDFEDLRLTALDPPAHTRMRGFAHRAFTPRRVAELRPTVESILRQLLDEASPKDTVDLIDSAAYKMPLYVIGGMLRFPDGDRHLIRHWSSVRAAFIGTNHSNLEEQSTGTAQFRAYIRSLVACGGRPRTSTSWRRSWNPTRAVTGSSPTTWRRYSRSFSLRATRRRPT